MSNEPSMVPGAESMTGVPSGAGAGAATATAGIFDAVRPDRYSAKDYEQMGLDVEHLELGTPALDAMRFLMKRALAPMAQQLNTLAGRIQQLESQLTVQQAPAQMDYSGYIARMSELVPNFGALLRTQACLGWRAQTEEFQHAMDTCDVATSYRLLQGFFGDMQRSGWQWTVNGWQELAQPAPTGLSVPGGPLSQTTLRPSMPVVPANGGKPKYTESQVEAVFTKANKGIATPEERAMCADMTLALQEGRVISG